jgi:phytanoyl-CoA hydroxylase
MKDFLHMAGRMLSARVRTRNYSIIVDEAPSFDTDSFGQKASLIRDPWLRDHVLSMIAKGYAIIPNAVPSEIINLALDAFYGWKERNKSALVPSLFKSGHYLDRIINIQSVLPEFRSLFALNESLAVQDFLFGTKASCYTSLFFESGTEQALHRDVTYFWTNPANYYFGMWTALEDVDCDNGALMVIPGSHKIGSIDRASIASEFYSDYSKIPSMDTRLSREYNRIALEKCLDANLEPVTLPVKKGTTILWHPLLAHGGSEVKDKNRSRLSFVAHTTPEGVPVYKHNVFFRPDSLVSRVAPWRYTTWNKRAIADTGGLSIGHAIKDFDFKKLS